MSATNRNAAALPAVIRRALSQDENTPVDERLSFRVLVAEALPLLEQMAERNES